MRVGTLATFGSAGVLALLGSLGLVGILTAPPKAPASNVNPATLTGGKELFDYWCAQCHAPKHNNPDTRHANAQPVRTQNKAPSLTERTDLAASYVSYIVRHGVSLMPIFPKTEISDQQLDALSAYLSHTPSGTTASAPSATTGQ